MRFTSPLTATLLAGTALFSATYASPLASPATVDTTRFPVVPVDTSMLANLTALAAHPSSSSRVGSPHPDGTVHSTLVTCTSSDCSTGCINSGLPTMFETCLGLPPFNSFGVLQQFGEALGYGVAVGPQGCNAFFEIPVINTCFTITSGGLWQDFFLIIES